MTDDRKSVRLLTSLTKREWVWILIILSLGVVCLYGGLFPIAVYWAYQRYDPTSAVQAPSVKVASVSDATPILPADASNTPSQTRAPATVVPTLTPTRQVTTPTRTRTRTPTRTALRTPTRTPTPSPTATPTETASPTQTSTPTRIPEPQALAGLELNPNVALANRATFFTSACYGADANALQNNDFMAPADWARSPDRKCVFGYRVDPKTGMPAGRYTTADDTDGGSRFYIIPPDAFSSDTTQVKQLSEMHLIVDPIQGCAEMGSIGITADGTSYRCPVCDFVKAGGMCLSQDKTKSLVLPTSSAFILDPARTGGAIGFQGFPLVFFRRGFSVYLTGKTGYPPPRLWFESAVETLRPESNARTTSEMTNADLRGISYAFDTIARRGTLLTSIAAAERPAQLTSASPVRVGPRESAAITFRATPGTVLSSLVWTIRPMGDVNNNAFMETNLCMDLNGERTCFTGVEDFAHCAFYTACATGFSSLAPFPGGYKATRYFPAGAAPRIHDPNIKILFQGPDIGAGLEMSVELRVRSADDSEIAFR